MKKLLILLASCAAFFVACGDSSTSVAGSATTITVETEDDLPNCTESRDGDSAYIADTRSTYICKNERWSYVHGDLDSVTTKDDLPSCTKSRYGDSALVTAENAVYICESGTWKKAYARVTVASVKDSLPACSGSREGNSAYVTSERSYYICENGKWEFFAKLMDSVSTLESLSACTANLEGDSAYVKDSNAVYLCLSEKWRLLGSVVATEDSLPNCTEGREDMRVFLVEEHASLICSEEKWKKYDIEDFIEDEDKSSSSAVNSSSSDWETYEKSSSSEAVVESSSSVVVSSSSVSMVSSSSVMIVVSSSSVAASSSSVVVSSSSQEGFVTWTGESDLVLTGFDSTYWWFFTDEEAGGTSTFTWPVSPGNAYGEKSMDPIIQHCAGICGTMTLGDGIEYPYLGVGFNLTSDGDGEDISSWGGLCIAYKSTGFALKVKISDLNNLGDDDFFRINLPITSTIKTINLPWSSFSQEGWGSAFSRNTALSTAVGIQIAPAMDVGAGESTSFSITQFGPYGGCN